MGNLPNCRIFIFNIIVLRNISQLIYLEKGHLYEGRDDLSSSISAAILS